MNPETICGILHLTKAPAAPAPGNEIGTSMNRQQLAEQSERYLRDLLQANLRAETHVYLFGSRARRNGRWNSDFDLWVDDDVDAATLQRILDAIEESFVPFRVDIVTTRQLKGNFGDRVRKDAVRWI